MDQSTRTRVAIIFGGVSSEHDVSCLTAGSVARAIDPERFEVVGIGITPSGRWVQVATADLLALDVADNALPRLDETRPDAVLIRGDGNGGGRIATLDDERLAEARDFDVAFALLHGPFGEDGTIQGLFEMMGIRYVGAGVAASAIGMDKDLMKHELRAAGLAVCPWVALDRHTWAADRAGLLLRMEADLAFPVYVKPARGGSSIGISRAETPAHLPAAIEEALRYDAKVIVEEGFVGAREIEVAVLDVLDGAPRTSLAGEIVVRTEDAFYDYAAKYLPEGQVDLVVPAPISDALLARVQKTGARTFRAMGAEGLSRVDLFVTPDEEIYVNELNTMPGFTHLSMYPMLWDASGLRYPDLIAELIELALTRPMGLR
ncbi:D-alanine--D-alanine ligase [Propioniciclava coleopterorum]|uniref:D-alanine--D-alanine ligase n=1 Tax=Propioniciclava coleopterorum TaxID=2714937 RepID=A0A6G7Y978_9ACTN|nr:D-alanine--D-alanine ligase family protein [Propioniciclava coleopterorum]QIK73372.1 D-alanine--D-alanine ligase [Propioniciclava coleopterorum]